jgi:predicted transporter
LSEECGVNSFLRRILFKLSGQKIISVIVSSLLIFLIVWARHKWAGHLSDDVAKAAIEAIKLICLGLLGGNVALGMTDIIKGKKYEANGDNGDVK